MGTNKKISKMLEGMDIKDVRKMLFTPCTTQKQLENWMKVFIDLELPNCTVDERSTSNPMANVWEIYEKALKADDPDFNRVLAYAARDSGKCQEKGTKILSRDKGLVNIEDAIIGDIIWSGKSWSPITDWIHDGIKDAVRVTLSNGGTFTGTNAHRVWAWSPNEEPGWKYMSDLTTKDIVRWDTESGWGQEGEIDEEHYDFGYLCGLLTGDGCLTLMNKYRSVVLSNTDPFVIDFWKKFCVKIAGREPKNKSDKPCDWRISSTDLCDRLWMMGLDGSYSWQKKIPSFCMTNRSSLVGFISGLFDTDGTVDKSHNHVAFQITANEVLKELHIAFAALGIDSFLHTKPFYPQHGQKHTVHELRVNANAFPRFIKSGIKLTAQKANIIRKALTPDAHDGIPKEQLQSFLGLLPTKGGRWRNQKMTKPRMNHIYKEVTRNKIDNLLMYGQINGYLNKVQIDYWSEINKCRWSKVVNVESGFKADFYDLSVEKDHSYWSNGIVSHNTLSASVLELLMMFHLERSMVHMAAIEAQAQKSQSYVKAYLRKPYLRDFVIGNNKRMLEIVKYVDMYTGDILSASEWNVLPKFEQDRYEQKSYSNKIVIASLRGANGDHSNFNVLDELDICNPIAFEEAKMIPAPFEGKPPITLLTSSRKFSYGLVQKEIDAVGKTGLHIRHWNIIDVTAKCPVERHRPDLPKVSIYYNEDSLHSFNEEDFQKMNEEERKGYTGVEGFDGCVNGKCKIFAACKGRLATHQTSTSVILKDVNVVQNLFKTVAVESARSQLLCWTPSAEGMIYGRLDFNKHTMHPHRIAEFIMGQSYPTNMSKQQLLQLLKNNEKVKFFAGMDFGFTDAFAVMVGAVFGNKCFIIEAFELEKLELQEQINFCDQKLKHYEAVIYPDTSAPGNIKSFRRAGYNMRDWKKLPSSILDGINIVRAKISPVIGEPELYFLRGDDSCESAFRKLASYHWQTDAQGNATDVPDGDDDHFCDALRYLIMNVFNGRNKMITGSSNDAPLPNQPIAEPTVHNYLRHFIDEALNDASAVDPNLESTGKVGKIGWSF